MKKVIPAMQKGEHTEVVAIASRSAEKGREVAHYLGIPRWHGSYEALLADPDVDAVYNPFPNDQRVLWSIRALKAGWRTDVVNRSSGSAAPSGLRKKRHVFVKCRSSNA